MSTDEKKHAEEELRESMELCRTLFDNSEDGYVVVEPIFDETGDSNDYHILQVNSAWERQTGFRAADFVGKRIRQSLPNVEHFWPATFAEVARTGRSKHFESYNADSKRWYDIHAFPFRNGQVGILFRDITKSKRAEEALRLQTLKAENEKRYLEAILQVLPVGVVVTDVKGGVLHSNNMDEKIWGLRPRTREVDDYLQYKAWWADSGRPVGSHEWASAQAVLKAESVIGQVLKIQRFNGERGYIINSAVPIRNDEGLVIGSAVAIQDITELRNAEQEKLESIQGLNEYAYALTHNLKEPLRAIQNYVNFLFEDLADRLEGEPKKYLEGIKDAVSLGNRQLRDLETLYKVKNHPINLEPFEMSELLEEMHSMFKNTSVRKLIYSKTWPLLRSGRYFFRQILINLIGNAFKFNCSNIKQVEIGWHMADNNGIEIFVRDNGIGIDSQYHEQIFDIFKRLHTERQYEGTGIGLSIVKRSVQRIGGKLRLESKVGKGSTFYVDLPTSILQN
jgi:PAS domain S-box-containing protein